MALGGGEVAGLGDGSMEVEAAGADWTNVSAAPADAALAFGPQRDSLYIVVPITVLYIFIFVSGLIGNVCTCIVITRNKSLHTATNYYLFSLAVSDLLLLVSGLPQEVYWIWSKWPYVFGEGFCMLRGLAAETSTNASILTITSFTVERYVAICHPFQSHKMSKLSRAVKHILLVWLISFGFALPQALQFGLREHAGVVMCLQTKVILEHSFEISTFLFFFAPMVVITALYALIGLRLSRSRIKRNHSIGRRRRQEVAAGAVRTAIASDATSVGAVVLLTPRSAVNVNKNYEQSTRRVIKMLVAVVVAFFLCWAPFHAQRLVAIYGTSANHQARTPTMLQLYAALTYLSGVLYYLSTAINPFLYHIMSNKFRDAFKNTLADCWSRRGRRRLRLGARREVHGGGNYSPVARRRNTALSSSDNSPGNSVRDETLRFSHTALKSQTSNRSLLVKSSRQSSRSLAGAVTPASPSVAAVDDDYARLTSKTPNSDMYPGRRDTRLCRPPTSELGRDGGEASRVDSHHPHSDVTAARASARCADQTHSRRDRHSLQDSISNSSLREVERRDLQDELTNYMRDLSTTYRK